MTLRNAIRETGAIAIKIGWYLGVLHPLRTIALAGVRRGKGSKTRTLIVQLDNLGDVALALGGLRSLIKGLPHQEVTILCDRASEALMRQVASEVIVVDRKKMRGSIFYAIKTLARIKQKGFGTLIHYSTVQLGLVDYYSIISLSGATTRIGYAGEAIFAHPHEDHWYDHVTIKYVLPRLERIYTKLVPSYDNVATGISHVLHHYQKLHEGSTTGPFDPIPTLEIAPHTGAKYIVMGLGAAVAYRQWPVERFAAVGTAAREAGYEVILVGIAKEAPLGEACTALLPEAKNLIGKTSLTETLKLIAGAAVVVSNETSLVHLAVALKTPALCILGGGHLGRCSLHGYPSTRWIHIHMGCDGDDWACGRALPPGKPAPCINAIQSEPVIEELRALLAQRDGEGDASRAAFSIP